MFLPRRLLALLGATLFLLAGCGGGAGGGTTTPDTPAPPNPTIALTARSSSATHAAVSWSGGSAGTPLRLERRAGDGGDYGLVASVDSGAGLWLDGGLSADTAYAYRLSRADGSVAATASTRTGTDAALTTAAPEAVGAALALPFTSATSRLSAADGSLQLDLPAGSFAQAGTATLQPTTNPLPDGVGPGLTLSLPERPARALTLSLRYGADESADDVTADRIALRQADGSWWLLPLLAHDEAKRLLQVSLPPSSWVAQPTAKALQARATATATAPSVKAELVRVKAHKLVPAAATVRVLGRQRFVPVSIYQMSDTDDCEGEELCVPSIVMRDVTVPVLNTKAGFQRQWTLEGSATPDASLGTLAAEPQSGVVYTAPAQVPATNPLTLRFRSVNSANGRRLVLSASIRVAEDAWVGRLNAHIGTEGQGGLVEVDTRWTLDAAQSTVTRRVYRPSGTATHDYFLANSPCQHTVSPRQVTLAQARSSGQLVVDESTTPPHYTLDLATIWDATLTASCPGGTTSGPYPGGHLWSAEGSVANGRITGSDTTLGDRKWSLGRPQ